MALCLRRRRLLLFLLTAQLLSPRAEYRLHRHRFRISDLRDDYETLHYFRLSIPALRELVVRLQLPQHFTTRSGFPTDAEEALLITLNRLAYPSRQLDQFNGRFDRHPSEISEIWLRTCGLLYDHWRDRIMCYEDFFLPTGQVRECAEASAHLSGYSTALVGVFIDGTTIPITRPGGRYSRQRVFFDGQHRTHAIKLLTLLAPSGLTVAVFGPWQGTMTDITAYNTAGIAEILRLLLAPENAGHAPNDRVCCLGDSAFPPSDVMLTLFPNGPGLTAAQRHFNAAMSSLRVSIEHSFKDLKKLFAKLAFSPTLQVAKGQIGIEALIATFFLNCRVCVHGTQTMSRFHVLPPTFEQYLHP